MIQRLREWWFWHRPVTYRRLQRCVSDAVATTKAEEHAKRRERERRLVR